MLQHGRPGNRPDKRHVSLGYSSLLLPSITWVPSGAPLLLQTCSVHPPPLTSPENIVALWSACVCVLNVGVSPPWVRPPSINRYSSLPTTEPGGPWARTKRAFFFVSLMRTRRKRGRKNVWQKKRWRDFSKQPQRIYLTEGERRERESQETFWMGRQICAHGTTLHPCYLSLPPDKQQYTTAGCCLSVMTTIVQISGCSQAQSLWLLGLDLVCVSQLRNKLECLSFHPIWGCWSVRP